MPDKSGTAALLALLLSALPLQAAETAATDASQALLPEEIVITGERTMLELRTELWNAELAAYDLFNQFNDERRFRIHCREHAPTGSRIKRQVCAPEFELELARGHALDYLESLRAGMGQGGSGFQDSHPQMEHLIAKQLPEYRAKMKQIAEENPQFLEAIIRYSDLKDRYQRAIQTGMQEED